MFDKLWRYSVFLILTTLFSFAFESPSSHIVTTEWLAKNLEKKEIVVIDARPAAEYKKGYIKGAINFPKKSYFQGKIGDIPKWPSTPEQVQSMLQKAGVTEKSLVVFTSAGKLNKDFADAASGVWNLWIYGVKNTAILDGGMAKWSTEKRPVTTELPQPTPSDLEIEKVDGTAFASLVDVMEAIYDEEIQISDARVSKFYRGEDKRKDLARHGRIPTAKLTPVIRYVKKEGSAYVFLAPDEAKKTLHNEGYGVELDKPLIIYCNTGHKARGLWFVAKFIAGMKDVKVYDGSMVEYSRTLLPVETGEPMD